MSRTRLQRVAKAFVLIGEGIANARGPVFGSGLWGWYLQTAAHEPPPPMGMHACTPATSRTSPLLQCPNILIPCSGLFAAGHADAAPRAGGQPGAAARKTPQPATITGPPNHAPKYAPNFVLVQLKPGAAAAAAAAGAAKSPLLPGLQLTSFVGEHHGIKVPASGGPAVAAAAVAKAPANAVMRFRITDGSKVEAKVKQLKANPGAGAWACKTGRCGTWVNACLMPRAQCIPELASHPHPLLSLRSACLRHRPQLPIDTLSTHNAASLHLQLLSRPSLSTSITHLIWWLSVSQMTRSIGRAPTSMGNGTCLKCGHPPLGLPPLVPPPSVCAS